MAYTLDNDRLEKMLSELCEKLIQSNQMLRADKEKSITLVKDALINTFPDGVPQDLFTDLTKQKTLAVSLITAPLMDRHPDLQFDLNSFFKLNPKPEECKAIFKAFLTTLNKLEPNPNKKRTEKEIDEEVDARFEKIQKEMNEAGKEFRLIDSKAISKDLDDVFESLFGMTRQGMPVLLTVNRGNTAGIADTYSASSLGGGSIHEGRDLAGDSTTNPDVTAKAEQRLLGIAGLNASELKHMMKSGVLHNAPTLEP